MLLKPGVDISRLRPQIRKKLSLINNIFEHYNQALVITSTYEGTHSAGSIHYSNLAFDCRNPEEKRTKIVAELTEKLGNDYDVVAETNHIHVEYDPRSEWGMTI